MLFFVCIDYANDFKSKTELKVFPKSSTLCEKLSISLPRYSFYYLEFVYLVNISMIGKSFFI